MNSLLSIFIALLTTASCSTQKAPSNQSNRTFKEETKIQVQEMPILEYEVMSRGFYQKITIEKNKAIVVSGRNTKPIAYDISNDDMLVLLELYKNVNKEGLKDLKDPTQKRFYDGAPIARFKIIDGENTYETVDFDGGFPPAEIKEIVEKVIEVTQKEVK